MTLPEQQEGGDPHTQKEIAAAIMRRSQSARSVPEILDDVREQNAMPPGSEHWEAGQS